MAPTRSGFGLLLLTMRGRRRGSSLRFAVIGTTVTLIAGCRKDPPAPAENGPGPVVVATDANSGDEPRFDASGMQARDLEAREEARRDAGAVTDPACVGTELSLFDAALNERCTISEHEYLRLTSSWERFDGGGTTSLRQEARTDEGYVVFALVNASAAPRAIPIRLSLERSSAFSVLADDGHGLVYELAAPQVQPGVVRAAEALMKRPRRRVQGRRAHDLPATGEDAGSPSHVQTSAIRLASGGRATARLTIDPTIVARLGPKGAMPSCGPDAGQDASACALPKGRYTLYVGQLLSEIEAGPPARVVWNAP